MNMRRPKELNPFAWDLWDLQSKRCEASGYLTAATMPAFVSLCMAYGKMKSLEDGTDWRSAGLWLKYYDSFSKNCKHFGMIPDPAKGYTDDSGVVDEFGMRH